MFSKEGNIIAEHELLDMVVLERISALLATQQKSIEEKREELKLISQAETLIQNLPKSRQANIDPVHCSYE